MKKLNLNTMKVAQPLSKATISLLDNLNSIYSQKDLVVKEECCNFDEQLNDEREDIIDIEVCEPFKSNDMATLPSKEDFKKLGAETALVYFGIKSGKNDEEIMERFNITSKKINSSYLKLLKCGYIKASSYIAVDRDNALNMPQNEPSEVSLPIETNETNETITEYEKSIINDFEPKTFEELEKEEKEAWGEDIVVYQSVPKKNEEILNDLYQQDYMDSHSQKNKKGEVFNYTNKDRVFDFEKEEFPIKKFINPL